MTDQEYLEYLIVAHESELGVAIECPVEDMKAVKLAFYRVMKQNNMKIHCIACPDLKEIWLCKELMNHLEK